MPLYGEGHPVKCWKRLWRTSAGIELGKQCVNAGNDLINEVCLDGFGGWHDLAFHGGLRDLFPVAFHGSGELGINVVNLALYEFGLIGCEAGTLDASGFVGSGFEEAEFQAVLFVLLRKIDDSAIYSDASCIAGGCRKNSGRCGRQPISAGSHDGISEGVNGFGTFGQDEVG